MEIDDLAGDPAASRKARRPARTRWRFRAAAAYLALMVGAVAFYETPDAARSRRLAAVHRRAAAECRRQARTLRAAGRVDEADRLAHSARDHDWFADAHLGTIRKPTR